MKDESISGAGTTKQRITTVTIAFSGSPQIDQRSIISRTMRIATYNVNGVNGHLPESRRWLQEPTPDVVCLQELKAPQEKFPEQAPRDAGYYAIWHGQKS